MRLVALSLGFVLAAASKPLARWSLTQMTDGRSEGDEQRRQPDATDRCDGPRFLGRKRQLAVTVPGCKTRLGDGPRQRPALGHLRGDARDRRAVMHTAQRKRSGRTQRTVACEYETKYE